MDNHLNCLIKSAKKMLLISLFASSTLAITANNETSTYEQAHVFEFRMENTAVKNVFSYIEKNSEFIFLYSGEVLNPETLVSIEVKDGNIYDVMNKLSDALPISYTVKNRQVTITKRREVMPPLPKQSQQGRHEVTGVIIRVYVI